MYKTRNPKVKKTNIGFAREMYIFICIRLIATGQRIGYEVIRRAKNKLFPENPGNPSVADCHRSGWESLVQPGYIGPH
jgi:hypothetical protein